MAFFSVQAAKGRKNENRVPFSRLREADVPGAAFEEAQGEMGHGVAVLLWDWGVKGSRAPRGNSSQCFGPPRTSLHHQCDPAIW